MQLANFVGYGVQKRRSRLVTINRAKPWSFYDLGIRCSSQVCGRVAGPQSKKWIDSLRILGNVHTDRQQTKCLTNKPHYAFYWSARSVQSSPDMYPYPPPHKVRPPPCPAISNAYKYHHLSRTALFSKPDHTAKASPSVKLASPTRMERLRSPPTNT